MYKIIRFYKNTYRKRVIATGLTLAEAQSHCRNSESSSSTATGKVAKARTRKVGEWFDGYEESNGLL